MTVSTTALRRAAGTLAATALGVVFSLSAHMAHAAVPVAQTTDGRISGVDANDGVNRFFGIPYAKPPVGALRWKAPQPPAAWAGTRNASRFGSSCPQDADMFGPASANEDCLTLNVYAPATPSAATRPVLVYIHGGGFLSGAGSYYDASVLAQKTDSVVVTINYRLGVLGFLTTTGMRGESRAVNFGLQDQYAALRWVQRNASAFGGDASRVTIAGQSAGAISGCLALVSPKAAGLFHRVIMHSGPCVLATQPLDVALTKGDAVATKAGCAKGSGQMACLRGKSVAALLAATRAQTPAEAISNASLLATIDGEVVTGAVLSSMVRGQFHRVPILLGTTQDEGRGLIGWGFHGPFKRDVTQAEYEGAMKSMGGELAATLVTTTYSAALYGSVGRAAAKALTDVAMACSAVSTARAVGESVPTYAFEFGDRRAPQFFQDPYFAEGWGAYHMGDLLYIFQKPVSGLQFPALDASQRALSEQMVGYWRNFIHAGSPNDGPFTGLPYWPRHLPVGTAVQSLKTTGISPMLLGEYALDHQCLLWSTTYDLGALTGQY